jgi:ABC-2 type transport system permease protein
MDALNTRTTPQAASGELARVTGILRAEWCKLRSVRSTFWTLALAVGFNVGLAALFAIVLPSRLSARDLATVDSVRLSLGGLHLSQIAFGVLGVLAISGEYGTGTIRATLSAVPQRRLLLAAKTLVFAVAALVVGMVACVAAYAVFQAFLPVSGSGEALRLSIGDPGVLRAVTGGGLYLAVLGLLGLGLGAIVRSSAGAIAALFGALFVPPLLITLLPHAWEDTIGPYLPMQAGSAVYLVHKQPDFLGPWAGFGVFCLYAAAALATGFFLIKHRDASPS